MTELERLENKSIFLIREAYNKFKNLGLLWSIGKDSTVLLWLVRKAFFGHVPFPLIHIDTHYKIPEMIAYRNSLACELGLSLLVGQNEEALKIKQTFPSGAVDRVTCCKNLKTLPLSHAIKGENLRKLNLETKRFENYDTRETFSGLILGIRSDEEGTRSKERYFSPRNVDNQWEIKNQPPEFWNQYKTEFAPGTHVRVHPLLDWTELNIWEYIEREKIPTVSLYYDQGSGKRYRSLGCYPCTQPVSSTAKNPKEIILELKTGKFSRVHERSGRDQDKEDGGGLERLRMDGYM